jgi:hypothetical protein
MNIFTHLWKGRSDLPKTSDGFVYEWKHVQILASRINGVLDGNNCAMLHVYTNLYETGRCESVGKVQIKTIPMPKGFFDHERCYGRLLSFKDSLQYAPLGSRIFIDLDMVPGPDFNSLAEYRTAFLYQKMVATQREQINGGLMVINEEELNGLSEEFESCSKTTINRYRGNFIGSDQAVISGYVAENCIVASRIRNVEKLKDFKFRFSIPKTVSVIACSGRRNPFTVRSRIIYPFLNFN